MKTATLFTKFVIVEGQYEFREILERFGNPFYEPIITPLRKMLEDGNQKGFDEGKSKLPAVTFCAPHEGGRDKKHRTGYNKVIIGDIDHISESDMPVIRQKIISCDCVLACFVSPSGHGLKFIVPVSSGEEDHLLAFNSVMQFFELLLDIKIDRSGKDISRLCYVTYDPDIYVNWNAKIFDPYMGKGKPVYPPKPVGPVLKGDNVVDPGSIKKDLPLDGDPVLTIAGNRNVSEEGRQQSAPLQVRESFYDMYTRCIEYTERYYQYVDGQRNAFTYALSCNLLKAGMDESFTLSLLLKDFNFNEREVRNCVKSAYSRNISDRAAGSHFMYNPGSQTTPVSQTDVPAPDRASRRKSEREQKKLELTGVTAGQTAPPIQNYAEAPDILPEKKKKIQGPQYTFDEVEAYIRANYETRNNIVSGRLEWRFAHTNTPFMEMDDVVVNSLFCDLHHMGQFIPINTLHLLLNSKFSPPINPFIEYFNGLTWDGVTDYIGQLAATVKTHDEKHWNGCLKKWIVAFAAGMVVDKIINHTVIVLIGDQGIGKTTFIRRILPEALSEYLGTSTMLTDNKDTSIQLSECGLIILDEI